MIGLLSAIPPELAALRDLLGDSTRHDLAGTGAWEGTLDGHQVVVAEVGIGKVNAAVATTLAVERFAPSLVVFTGVAGGVDPALGVGDVVVADRAIQHDAGVWESERIRTYQAGHVPFFNPTDRLGYSPDPDLVARVTEAVADLDLAPVNGHRPSVVTGTVLTGDQFLSCAATRERLHAELGGSVVEMEGAAVAQACERLGVGHLLIRAVSDLAGADSDLDFGRFLHQVAANSMAVVRRVLEVA